MSGVSRVKTQRDMSMIGGWMALRSAPPMDVYDLERMQGQCDGPPPDDFNLTEALPPGACALRVREDFLDAPNGAACLLLDSLYVLIAPPVDVMANSVLILHVQRLPHIHWQALAAPCIHRSCSDLALPHPLPPSQARPSSKPGNHLQWCAGRRDDVDQQLCLPGCWPERPRDRHGHRQD